MELTKENHAVASTPNSQALSQFVEFSWKATRGLVEETQNHVQQLVTKLAASGKITPEDQVKLSNLVNGRMIESRKIFLNNIDTHIKTAVEKITVLSNSEVEKLQTDIAALEKKISQLSAR